MPDKVEINSVNLSPINLLFLATANFDIVSEVIAHIKFLNKNSSIYVLAPDNLYDNFNKLMQVDYVLHIDRPCLDDPSAVSLEIMDRLKSIRFNHIYLISEFNTGNPLNYLSGLEIASKLNPDNISLVNYNLRSFPYVKKIVEKRLECDLCHADMIFCRYTTYPSVCEPMPLYKCRSCDFISQDGSTNSCDKLKEDYINSEIPFMNYHGEMVDKDHQNDLKLILPYLPNDSIIVDMGCGAGGLEYYARRDGLKVRVISFDLNQGFIKWARKHGIKAHSVDIANEKEIAAKLESLNAKNINCIYSNNSLEHLLRPSEILKAWSRLLVKGGYLHITIPTVDFIFDEYRAFELHHMSYFSHHNITQLINSIGLTIEYNEVFNKKNNAGTGYMKFFIRKP